MSQPNPYQPSQFSGQLDSGVHGGGVSPTVVSHLVRTKPWVQLIGILAIIGAVLMVGAALIMMVGGGVMTASMQKSSGGAALPAGVVGLMGGFYLACGLVYLWLGIKLIGYGSAIGSLRASGSVQHLEVALDHQRSFWKTMGILTLIGIVVVVIGMIGAMVVGMTMASKFQPDMKTKQSSSESNVIPDTTDEVPDATSVEKDK